MPVSAHPEITQNLRGEPPLGGQPAKKGSSSLWLVLLVVALVVVGASRFVLKGKQETPRIRVVAAAVDLPPGTRLGYSNIRYMDLPKEYVTRQMVSSTHLLVGRCTAQYVCKAEPVLLSDVLPARNGISSELAEGERAVTLHLQKEAMLDLLAEPGDLVDVMYTISHKGERYTRTICQQARVLVAMSKAAEAEVHGKQIGSSAITLAVTKGEAELLAHAQGSGKLQLVLRNRADREELTPETIVDGTVFPGLPVNSTSQAQATAPVLPGPPRVLPPPPPVMPPAQLPGDTGERLQEPAGNPLWSIEMFSGNKREVYAVPRPVH